MAAVNFLSGFEKTASRFHQASAQTQLVALYYAARKIHKTSKMAAPSAFFSQTVNEVLKQIQQLPKGDRCEALEEILHGAHTRMAEAYDELDTNMRMALWYRLANDRDSEALLPGSYSRQSNQDQETLFAELDSLDSNELVAFLRTAVAEQVIAAY